jgi:hypothetical protein
MELGQEELAKERMISVPLLAAILRRDEEVPSRDRFRGPADPVSSRMASQSDPHIRSNTAVRVRNEVVLRDRCERSSDRRYSPRSPSSPAMPVVPPPAAMDIAARENPTAHPSVLATRSATPSSDRATPADRSRVSAS